MDVHRQEILSLAFPKLENRIGFIHVDFPMPATYRIDRVNRVVLSAATGTFTAADAWQQIGQLRADPEFNPAFGQLMDFSQVGPIQITPKEIEHLAEISLFLPSAKRAFVSPTPLLYGLARMYVAQRELQGDTAIAVFRNVDEALAWLGLQAPPRPV